MYKVVQYTNSRYEDGTREVQATGREHEYLDRAAIEVNARELEQGEGKPRWHVVDESGNAVELADVDIEVQDVYDYLVDVMGLDEAEAQRLVD
jgi:hypothetical protein